MPTCRLLRGKKIERRAVRHPRMVVLRYDMAGLWTSSQFRDRVTQSWVKPMRGKEVEITNDMSNGKGSSHALKINRQKYPNSIVNPRKFAGVAGGTSDIKTCQLSSSCHITVTVLPDRTFFRFQSVDNSFAYCLLVALQTKTYKEG